jgi:sec-independent protein translocase protein TatA
MTPIQVHADVLRNPESGTNRCGLHYPPRSVKFKKGSMLAIVEMFPLLAGMLGGWEVILILVVILILFGAKHLPNISQGFGRGFFEFRKGLSETLDDQAVEAGKSVGGVYGKAAAEALTPDNQNAELYDPAVLRAGESNKRFSLRNLFHHLWHSIVNVIGLLLAARDRS